MVWLSLQVAEAAKRKADEEVARVRAAASATEAQLRTTQEQLRKAESMAQQKEAEVSQLKLTLLGSCCVGA